MSHSQFYYLNLFKLTSAWLNFYNKHMTTGRINRFVLYHKTWKPLQQSPCPAASALKKLLVGNKTQHHPRGDAPTSGLPFQKRGKA